MNRLISLLVVAPLPAAVVGLLVARASGVDALAFAPNFAAIAIGSLVVLAVVRSAPASRERMAGIFPIVVLGVVVVTLLAPGIDGVHRWLPLLHLNASAALAPWLCLGLTSASASIRARTLAIIVAVQAVHVAQPDASQASALAAGSLPLLVGGRFVSARRGVLALVALVALAAASWLRPDPVAPVDHVERIFALAAARGALWVALAAFAVVMPIAPFVVAARSPAVRPFALGSTLQLCALLSCTVFGDFPVPILGAGAAPVLGWYAMASVLVAVAPRRV